MGFPAVFFFNEREQVEEWLVSKGYDTNAIPYNYIDQPPSSLVSIEKNLALLHQLLVDTPTVALKAELLDSLRRVIYSKIDDYVELMECFIR